MSIMLKQWFLHIAGQPVGPLSLEEMMARKREGAFTPLTPVWTEGMAAWALAQDVAELKGFFDASSVALPMSPPPLALARASSQHEPASQEPQAPSQPQAAQARAAHRSRPQPKPPVLGDDFSHLIELKPGDVDDRTSSIDRKLLKSAKKEASRALKTAYREAKVVGAADDPNLGPKLVIAAAAVVIAGFVGYLVFGPASGSKQGDLRERLASWLSPMPAIAELSAEDNAAFQAVGKADAKVDGIRAAIAASTREQPGQPVFHVAANLPEGASLSFSLKGDPATLLSDKPVEIRSPLTLSKRLAKSKPMHLPDGSPLPAGEYVVSVSREDDATAGGALIATRRMFLGGAKDANYSAQLSKRLATQRDQALEELKLAAALAARLESQLALAGEAASKIPAAPKAVQAKLWSELDRKRPPSDAADPASRSRYYPKLFAAISSVWAEERNLHELQVRIFANQSSGLDPVQLQSDMNSALSRATQALGAIRAELGTAERGLAGQP
jgi:hypothetical protein